MKEFFQRQGVGLELADLRRFVKVLVDDLHPLLIGYDFTVRLLDAPEWESEVPEEVQTALSQNRVHREADSNKLYLPVVFDGRPLALITAVPPAGGGLAEPALAVLPNLIRLSLEKILLYKISVTDKETGLYNDDYFRAYIRQNLQKFFPQFQDRGQPKPLRLGEVEDHPGLTVLLVEIAEFEKLAATHGWIEGGRALRAAARVLKEYAPSPSCLARLDRGRFGLLLPNQDLSAGKELADRIILEAGQKRGKEIPPVRLFFGLTSFPLDFTEESKQAEPGESGDGALVERILDKADLALRQAAADKDRPVFTFRDILRHGGRIVQVLPYNRLIVNLGRLVGAREGQAFILSQAHQSEEIDYKGEVVLYDVREDFAVGELVDLRHSAAQVRPGDVLILSRRTVEEPPRGDLLSQQSLDPLLGVPDYHGFTRLLSERTESEERFALILVRVDGFDRFRTTMGHLESDRQFKALFDLLGQDLPVEAQVGRFGLEGLAVFCPGFDQTEALKLAEVWRGKVVERHTQTCSFGLAVFPCGSFARAEVLTNAQKALEHAKLLGPSSIAAFDSISLNISGDKLFETGDLDGAVREFKTALELNPADVNVLNSLGVCYGYQQRLDLALETFDRIFELDPENLMAHFNRGFALARLGRNNEALTSFRRAAGIDDRNFDVLFQLGRTALDLDLVEEALSSFQRAAALDNRRPMVFRYLGQTLLRVGRLEEAVDAFKAAVRYDPEDAPSLSQLAVLFMDRGSDFEVALSLGRQSVDLDPTNGLFRGRLARALTLLGHYKEAELEYLKAVNMGVRSREIHFDLGQILIKQGRLEEAADRFRQSLLVDPEYAPALEALAVVEKKSPA